MKRNLCKEEYKGIIFNTEELKNKKGLYDYVIKKSSVWRGRARVGDIRESKFIDEEALYCGITYCERFKVIDELQKLPPADTIIVDTLNVFQNTYLLILAVLVGQFTLPELQIILDIIDEKKINFIYKINLFHKIIQYFRTDNANMIFVLQGNIRTPPFGLQKINSVAGVGAGVHSAYLISVPCYVGEGGVFKDCYKSDIKNESDDVLSLILYEYFKSRNSVDGKQTYFWTFDNYDWYSGNKDSTLIQLKYIKGNENNILISQIGLRLEKRKDPIYQANTIFFESSNKYFPENYSYQSDNYKSLVNEIIYKYRNRREANDKLYAIINKYIDKLMSLRAVPMARPVEYPYTSAYNLPEGYALVPAPPVVAPIVPPYDASVDDEDMDKKYDEDTDMDKKYDEEKYKKYDEEIYKKEDDTDMDGGYYEKYLKYKTKYLNLKKILQKN